MKRLLTLAIGCLLLSGSLLAQSYSINQSVGTAGGEYEWDTPGTALLSASATPTDQLSSWQSLPFPFEFFGQPVTGYYASDNGYITFDQSATTSDPNNTAIPVAGGPNNAIYAFWDGIQLLTGGGTPDEVRSWTYGGAPNRVHVVQWRSVTPGAGTGFLYTAIRIYECGSFDVIHNWGSGTGGMTATIGAENASGTIAAQVLGSPNAAFPSVTDANTDDVLYTFFWEGTNYDVQVSSTNFTGGSVSLGNQNISGVIRNNGATAITSLTLNYTINGGTPVTDNITGINIPAFGGTYNFTHGTAWNVATGGQTYDVCVFATNLNGGNNDEVACNDNMCTELFSRNGTSGTKRVVIEEFSGAWCGWCPDGAVVLENILAANPGMAFGITVHDGDLMEFNDGIRSAFSVTAYPNGQVDRYLFDGETKVPHSRGRWVANTATRMSAFTSVNVEVGSVYNATTRQVTATINADFVDYEAGDLRFVLAVVEDGVTGTGTGYDQVNYLNTTAGHPYQGAGDPIVGYVHDHTLRMLPGGAFGNAGVIPATVSPSTTYSENFTFTLPTAYNEANIKLVGFVYKNESSVLEGEVLNVDEKDLGVATDINEAVSADYIEVGPNPVSELGFINAHFEDLTNARFEIYNAFGQQVAFLKEGNFAQGKHSVYFSTEDLANGVYIVSVSTPEKSFTKKIIVAK